MFQKQNTPSRVACLKHKHFTTCSWWNTQILLMINVTVCIFFMYFGGTNTHLETPQFQLKVVRKGFRNPLLILKLLNGEYCISGKIQI